MKHEKRTDYITLYAQGLDEGIRCAMCTNSMANDRGCDGGCVVDTAMYERVLKVIKECTVPESETLEKIRTDMMSYRDSVDRAISEDEFKRDGMKIAYQDCIEIIDKYIGE